VQSTLVDAGPLIALVDRSDRWHRACVSALQLIPHRLLTVWPAFVEAMYLVGKMAGGQARLFELPERRAIDFATLGPADFPRMRELMRKYRDLPMDLADASLIRVAEREKIRRVFTLDRRDFELYRPHALGRLQIIP
jgi:predicted nucleic acid-binding protein